MRWPKMDWPEITEDTPLEEVKRIHQQIWDYVIEHGEKPGTPYKGDCAACEYALCMASQKTLCLIDELHISFYELCKYCPIDWGELTCGCPNSLYALWRCSIHTKADELAKQIRDIPFKYELEE